jgi:pilus assembly protein CpaC
MSDRSESDRFKPGRSRMASSSRMASLQSDSVRHRIMRAAFASGLGAVGASVVFFPALAPAFGQDALTNGAAATQAAAAPAAQAAAAAEAHHPPLRGTISLSAGSGRVIHLPDAPANVFTADPKVAEVRPGSPNSLFVFGVAPGITTLAALAANGDPIAQYQVTVVPSEFDASQVRGAISHNGASGIATHADETGVTLSGHAATPEEASRAVAAAKASLPADAKVEDRMSVNEPIQVSLHVRVAEMTRTLTRELGVNWTAAANVGRDAMIGIATNNALSSVAGVSPSVAHAQLGNTGRGLSLDTVIDALSQDELVHVLAEPNLTTTSGQPASFLVGGEFPIPIASTAATGATAGTISIEFKQYGISLAFIPTVMSHDRISLHVRPEVSQLDKADGVVEAINGTTTISIPALTVRRADTTVELGSGQSFAIAGLLSDQTTQTIQSTPGLGDLPILGALFRSDSFNRAQTELVIVVTPYIVRPISDPNALRTSVDGFHAPNDLERILQLRTLGRGSYQGYGRIPADAGFIVE